MELKVIIRGGGDLATGIAHRLFRAGLKVIITELPEPLVIRRTVAFASAVYEGEITVEGVRASLVKEIPQEFNDYIPVMVDPSCNILKGFSPHVLVDARMMKHNPDIKKDMAPLVIALGPGYEAGKDAHKVIETVRGHFLGKIIEEGQAFPDTGVPGEVGGMSLKRLVKAPASGIFTAEHKIGDSVPEGDILGRVGGKEVLAVTGGVVRGLIKEGLHVKKGLKIGDVDPRGKKEYVITISDKARSLGGSVLEVILSEFSDRIIFR